MSNILLYKRKRSVDNAGLLRFSKQLQYSEKETENTRATSQARRRQKDRLQDYHVTKRIQIYPDFCRNDRE